MIAYTLQLAQWRKAITAGVELLDTTVKSGDPAFAPTWTMVRDIKAKFITPEQYSVQYRQRMLASFKTHTSRWREVIRGGPVAIACYCPAGQFCHRYLLADLFGELCRQRQIPFTYKGELQ